MKKCLSVLAAGLMILACQKQETTLRGNENLLTETPGNVENTVAFTPNENRFFGRAVNRYFGTYQIDGDKLILGPVGSTMMMGPEKAMAAEQQYFQDLARVSTFRATEKGLTLTLSDDKTLTFTKKGNVTD